MNWKSQGEGWRTRECLNNAERNTFFSFPNEELFFLFKQLRVCVRVRTEPNWKELGEERDWAIQRQRKIVRERVRVVRLCSLGWVGVWLITAPIPPSSSNDCLIKTTWRNGDTRSAAALLMKLMYWITETITYWGTDVYRYWYTDVLHKLLKHWNTKI